MRTVEITIKGLSPLSWSRKYYVEKKADETSSDFEKRTWREYMHYTQDGFAKIPGMAFKHALATAAKFANRRIPGQQTATYTKFFKSGVIVPEDVVLETKREDVIGEWYFVPSDGKRGGGSRVDKCFPTILEWGGVVTYVLLSDEITKEIFEEFVVLSGQIVGVGRFRPEREGINGRFEVLKVKWNKS